MTNARFLQIHTLHSYASALLNRDDSGLAKQLPYGGATRTRISSQCLKRHWRLARDPHALDQIDGASPSRVILSCCASRIALSSRKTPVKLVRNFSSTSGSSSPKLRAVVA